MDLSMTAVMKGVSEALRLDGDSKLQDAYTKYIECVLRITTKLLQDVRIRDGSVFVDQEVVKYVRLGLQCMERVNSVVNQLGKSRASSPVTYTSSIKSGDLQCSTLHTSGCKSEPSTPIADHSTKADHSITQKRGGISLSAPVPPLPQEPNVIHYKKKKPLSPMEIAYRQNKQLMVAYKARLESMKGPGNRSANLSLTVQRKMAENLAIAKVQEEALAKKMLERQQRLQEQANLKFGLSGEEQKEIYLKSLEYELDSEWLQGLRRELEQNPTEGQVINNVIQSVLSCSDHPLTQKLQAYQYKVYEKLYPLVSDKMADVKDIKVPLSDRLWPKQKLQEVSDAVNATIDNDDKGGKEFDHEEHNEDEVSLQHDHEEHNEDEVSLQHEHERHNEDENRQRADTGDLEVNKQGKDLGSSEENLSLDRVIDNVKANIEEALEKGDQTQKKLQKENQNIKRLAYQISTDYEKYSEENMDDLFEDDESEEEKDQEDSVESKEVCDSKMTQESSLGKYTANFDKIDKLKNEAYHRHLKGISEDVQTYLEKLISLFICVYDKLKSAMGRDHCYSLLEDPFFRPLWPYLLTLFRLANKPKEQALAYVMTVKEDKSPKDFGILEKLQLTANEKTVDPPYKAAIQELCSLSLQCTMLSKLECLVKCSRLICQCVEEYHTPASAPNIGADDLLPVLGYVIVKTGLPQIVSECHIMEEFIHEGYIMGEEGYCLTSVQTAVGYLVSLGIGDNELE